MLGSRTFCLQNGGGGLPVAMNEADRSVWDA